MTLLTRQLFCPLILCVAAIVIGHGSSASAAGCSKKDGAAAYKRCLGYMSMAGTPTQRKQAGAVIAKRNQAVIQRAQAKPPVVTAAKKKPSFQQCVAGCLAECGYFRNSKTGECMGSTSSPQKAGGMSVSDAEKSKQASQASSMSRPSSVAVNSHGTSGAVSSPPPRPAAPAAPSSPTPPSTPSAASTAPRQTADSRAGQGDGTAGAGSGTRLQPAADDSARQQDRQARGTVDRGSVVSTDSASPGQSPSQSAARAGTPALGRPAAAPALWMHNNSDMALVDQGGHLSISYMRPKPELEEIGIARGTVLFSGTVNAGAISGEATTFTRRCGQRTYGVTGIASGGGQRIELRGRKPTFDARCNVSSYREEVLIFDRFSVAGR